MDSIIALDASLYHEALTSRVLVISNEIIEINPYQFWNEIYEKAITARLKKISRAKIIQYSVTTIQIIKTVVKFNLNSNDFWCQKIVEKFVPSFRSSSALTISELDFLLSLKPSKEQLSKIFYSMVKIRGSSERLRVLVGYIDPALYPESYNLAMEKIKISESKHYYRDYMDDSVHRHNYKKNIQN